MLTLTVFLLYIHVKILDLMSLLAPDKPTVYLKRIFMNLEPSIVRVCNGEYTEKIFSTMISVWQTSEGRVIHTAVKSYRMNT